MVFSGFMSVLAYNYHLVYLWSFVEFSEPAEEDSIKESQFGNASLFG